MIHSRSLNTVQKRDKPIHEDLFQEAKRIQKNKSKKAPRPKIKKNITASSEQIYTKKFLK